MTTEEDYVEDLRVIVEIFMMPLQSQGILDRTDVVGIFSSEYS